MKLLSYILSVYLLVLLVVPCCAFDNCSDSEQTTEAGGIPKKEQNGCGSCSPFFACGDCVAVSMKTEFISFHFPAVEIHSPQAGFIPSFFPAVHYEFWHPPRVG